jgi:hypothetical protein
MIFNIYFFSTMKSARYPVGTWRVSQRKTIWQKNYASNWRIMYKWYNYAFKCKNTLQVVSHQQINRANIKNTLNYSKAFSHQSTKWNSNLFLWINLWWFSFFQIVKTLIKISSKKKWYYWKMRLKNEQLYMKMTVFANHKNIDILCCIFETIVGVMSICFLILIHMKLA